MPEGASSGNYLLDVPIRRVDDMEDRLALCGVIEITPDMIEAGVDAAWREPNAPVMARALVERVYRAMEATRTASSRPYRGELAH
jgi:hypothetical protein